MAREARAWGVSASSQSEHHNQKKIGERSTQHRERTISLSLWSDQDPVRHRDPVISTFELTSNGIAVSAALRMFHTPPPPPPPRVASELSTAQEGKYVYSSRLHRQIKETRSVQNDCFEQDRKFRRGSTILTRVSSSGHGNQRCEQESSARTTTYNSNWILNDVTKERGLPESQTIWRCSERFIPRDW